MVDRYTRPKQMSNLFMGGLRHAYDDVADTTTGVINNIAGNVKKAFDEPI